MSVVYIILVIIFFKIFKTTPEIKCQTLWSENHPIDVKTKKQEKQYKTKQSKQTNNKTKIKEIAINGFENVLYLVCVCWVLAIVPLETAAFAKPFFKLYFWSPNLLPHSALHSSCSVSPSGCFLICPHICWCPREQSVHWCIHQL